jgi:hypothetical protein
MRKTTAITCVFLDVGGVLLTNGWDDHARRRAAKHFKLDWAEMEDRHNLNFATYEEEKAHSRRVFRPGGLLPKAGFHSGSVRALHVRAIETLPRDDRDVL